jgi:hypothetical protein
MSALSQSKQNYMFVLSFLQFFIWNYTTMSCKLSLSLTIQSYARQLHILTNQTTARGPQSGPNMLGGLGACPAPPHENFEFFIGKSCILSMFEEGPDGYCL